MYPVTGESLRLLFSTFKGITRVSKESIFSDLNNLDQTDYDCDSYLSVCPWNHALPGTPRNLFDFPLGMYLRRSHDLHGSGDFQSFHAAGASGLSAERLGCHEDPGPDRQREGINRLLLHMLKRKDMQEFFYGKSGGGRRSLYLPFHN